MIRRICVLAALLLAPALARAAPPAVIDPATLGAPAFAEEFNGPLDASPMPGHRWRTTSRDLTLGGALRDMPSAAGRTLAANKEAEAYVDAELIAQKKLAVAPPCRQSPSYGGVAVMTATRLSAADSAKLWGLTWASCWLTTNTSFSQQGGYWEMRARLPTAAGLWPAFWLMSYSGWPPEIDVTEVPGKAQSCATAHSLSLRTATHAASYSTTCAPLPPAWHTYGVAWDKEAIVYYLDRREVKRLPTPPDFNQPFYIDLNLAVGAKGSWPGEPAPTLKSAQMLVDYVRVWPRFQ